MYQCRHERKGSSRLLKACLHECEFKSALNANPAN